MAEDMVGLVHLSHDTGPIAIELSGEEKVEKQSEHEVKEYLSDEFIHHLLIEDEFETGSRTILYQAPILSIPEVPPESSC